MTDDTTTDETDYDRPIEGPQVGHAAAGFVMGTRLPDNRRPEEVRIDYERNGHRHAAVVLRTSGRVEFDETDTVRFHTRRTNQASTTDTVYVDKLHGAAPVDPDTE